MALACGPCVGESVLCDMLAFVCWLLLVFCDSDVLGYASLLLFVDYVLVWFYLSLFCVIPLVLLCTHTYVYVRAVLFVCVR